MTRNFNVILFSRNGRRAWRLPAVPAGFDLRLAAFTVAASLQGAGYTIRGVQESESWMRVLAYDQDGQPASALIFSPTLN